MPTKNTPQRPEERRAAIQQQASQGAHRAAMRFAAVVGVGAFIASVMVGVWLVG